MKINNKEISNENKLTVFGGVNVIESDELLFQVAETFKEISVKYDFNYVFKASFDKANRSSLDSFRGPGLDDGLESLQKVKDRFELPLITDIHEPDQAGPVADVCDVIQIPAFLCRQTDLIVAASKTKKIINIKKPQFSSAKEMFHAVKKCNAAGNEDVILCERGNIFGYNNLVVDTLNFQILKQEGNPVFFDVTHSLQQPGMLEKSTGGRGQYVYELAKAGISQNIAGLFLETHPDPSEAKCDGPCALKLSELDSFMERVIALDEFVKNI
jgi:2-dehydro-3-deoxyphosphooctonate aldolase (KDO 8-P synthase)